MSQRLTFKLLRRKSVGFCCGTESSKSPPVPRQLDQVRWTEEAEQAFQTLKQDLTSSLFLWNPDFSLPFTVHSDASKTGLGAYLSQTFDSEEHPVLYVSRKLTPAECKYTATE